LWGSVGFWANCSQEPKSNFNLLTEGFSADTAFPYQLIVAIRNCHSQLSFGLSWATNQNASLS
jgi:hypothetical protein